MQAVCSPKTHLGSDKAQTDVQSKLKVGIAVVFGHAPASLPPRSVADKHRPLQVDLVSPRGVQCSDHLVHPSVGFAVHVVFVQSGQNSYWHVFRHLRMSIYLDSSPVSSDAPRALIAPTVHTFAAIRGTLALHSRRIFSRLSP
jgi:hypothetical protein